MYIEDKVRRKDWITEGQLAQIEGEGQIKGKLWRGIKMRELQEKGIMGNQEKREHYFKRYSEMICQVSHRGQVK